MGCYDRGTSETYFCRFRKQANGQIGKAKPQILGSGFAWAQLSPGANPMKRLLAEIPCVLGAKTMSKIFL